MVTGAICMELARQRLGPQFLQLAVRNLTRAQKASLNSLPIVSALLAQAEGSLGSKTKWEKNLRFEWFSWPPGFVSFFTSIFIHPFSPFLSSYFSVELFHN